MHKIIIVEDEQLINDFLVESIGWTNIGISVVGAYNNGFDALEGIRTFNPDIVLTDINMPKMNGLELIQKAKHGGYKNAFVIISGYNEFHYVKEAFKLGVMDYILKSELSPEELRRIVAKIIETKEVATAYRINNNQDYLIKENILKELIWGAKPLNIKDQKYRLHIEDGKFVIAIINFINYNEILGSLWHKESELLKYGITNILEEVLEENQCGEAFANRGDEIVFIFSDECYNSIEEKIRYIINYLINYFNKTFGFISLVGYSDFTDDTKYLKELYENCRKAVRYSFVKGRRNIVSYKENEEKEKYENENCDMKTRAELFRKNINELDFKKIIDNFDYYFYYDIHISNIDELLELYNKYINIMFYSTASFDRIQPDITTAKEILRSGELKDFNLHFYNILIKLKQEHSDDGTVVPKIQKYMKENYYKNITLESVAKEFGLGYQKLSRDFSKKTGSNFKKYLTEIRMKHAMELICTTEYLLYEISEMVGYANYENFSRIFYGYFGKWPKDIDR